MNAKQGLAILVAILLLLLMGVAYWGYTTNNEKKSLAATNENLTHEIGDLNALRDNLTAQVDSLQSAYASLAEENGNLQGALEAAKARVAEKEAAISKLKKQDKTETNNLKAQIEALLAAKTNLETSITDLRAENDSLRLAMGQLTEDLGAARSENAGLSSLNATIQEELKKLTLANFKASAFRVEVEMKKPKATAKSRRARKILVSFDLTAVVPKYQGVRTLYLVVTDDKGTPIKESTPINAKVNVNGQEMDIIAVKSQEVNVQENQRLNFNHELEDKLKSGYYRVAVYTDIGLLGASSFRLQ